MYYFGDLDRYDSTLLLNYLIDREPARKRTCLEEGYENYYECTNSYITDTLGYISNDIIRWMFEDLEKHNYLFIHHMHNNPTGKRYIKLNYPKIKFALGIDDEESDIEK